MAATLSDVRDAIKATIVSLSGLRAYDTAPDKPEFPCAVVVPTSGDFDLAFGRGLDGYEFDLQVMTQGASDRAGQDALDAYISASGTKSIRAAIWTASTLGLANTAARVTGFTNYSVVQDNTGARYFSATLQITVSTIGV